MASTHTSDALPRWSVADVHDNLDARSFLDAQEQVAADVDRLVGLFDAHGIRGVGRRSATADDAERLAP